MVKGSLTIELATVVVVVLVVVGAVDVVDVVVVVLSGGLVAGPEDVGDVVEALSSPLSLHAARAAAIVPARNPRLETRGC